MPMRTGTSPSHAIDGESSKSAAAGWTRRTKGRLASRCYGRSLLIRGGGSAATTRSLMAFRLARDLRQPARMPATPSIRWGVAAPYPTVGGSALARLGARSCPLLAPVLVAGPLCRCVMAPHPRLQSRRVVALEPRGAHQGPSCPQQRDARGSPRSQGDCPHRGSGKSHARTSGPPRGRHWPRNETGRARATAARRPGQTRTALADGGANPKDHLMSEKEWAS